jgi:hypothetical protein
VKNCLLRFFLLFCFSIIYKEPDNIEHAGKPGDYKNDVQCLEISVHVVMGKNFTVENY